MAASFKRIIVRGVLRDVYPMVMRLIAVPDSLHLSDFDELFHVLLGWDGVPASRSRFISLRQRSPTEYLERATTATTALRFFQQ